MKISLPLLRASFFALSLFIIIAFIATLPLESNFLKFFLGAGLSLIFSLLLFSLESLFKRYPLKALNTLVCGLGVGFLLAQALTAITSSLFSLCHLGLVLQPQTLDLIKVCIFLCGTYLGTLLTFRFSDEIFFSIPFIKLTPSVFRKKDLLIDLSALQDSRILDLAATGLLDNTLLMPRFLLNLIYDQCESSDEVSKQKAKRALETFKKLEALSHLALRYEETSFQGAQNSFARLLHLARMLDANVLTADISQVQIPPIEGIKIINLHALSNALKPLMQAGESFKIKIQRLGKEPNQGVGYLDDGTMVVVNGGGDFISENIDVQVLSVKHTSSGRMIFCNALDEMISKGNRAEL